MKLTRLESKNASKRILYRSKLEDGKNNERAGENRLSRYSKHELEIRDVEKHSEFQIWHNYINITQPFAYCLTVMGFLNFKFAEPVHLK